MTDARPPAAAECAERDARVENGGGRRDWVENKIKQG